MARLRCVLLSVRCSATSTDLICPVTAAHAIEPSLTAGNTSYDPEKAVHLVQYNVTKSEKLFGIKYITKEESTKDIIANFKEKKWIA